MIRRFGNRNSNECWYDRKKNLRLCELHVAGFLLIFKEICSILSNCERKICFKISYNYLGFFLALLLFFYSVNDLIEPSQLGLL